MNQIQKNVGVLDLQSPTCPVIHTLRPLPLPPDFWRCSLLPDIAFLNDGMHHCTTLNTFPKHCMHSAIKSATTCQNGYREKGPRESQREHQQMICLLLSIRPWHESTIVHSTWNSFQSTIVWAGKEATTSSAPACSRQTSTCLQKATEKPVATLNPAPVVWNHTGRGQVWGFRIQRHFELWIAGTFHLKLCRKAAFDSKCWNETSASAGRQALGLQGSKQPLWVSQGTK